MARTQLIDLWSAQLRALRSFARKTAGSCPTALTLHSATRSASLGPLLQQQRLQTIDIDLEREPESILRTFAVQTHRVEPAGAIYLWPQAVR